MNKKITFIVTTYNNEEYVEECILSIINQTKKINLEIIVVDDCSSDETLNKVKSLMNQYDQIRMIEQQEHIGNQATLKNKGIDLATGKYVAFLDGDDTLTEKTIEFMFKEIGRSKCKVVVGRLIKFSRRTIVPWDYKQPFLEDRLELKDEKNRLDFLSILVHKFSGMIELDYLKQLGIRFNEDFPIYCNELFSKELLLKSKEIIYIPKVLYRYRIRNNVNNTSLTNQHTYITSKEFAKFSGHLYTFCKDHNYIREYKSINYILTRNAITKLDFDFNKLPIELKKEMIALFRDIFSKTKQINFDVFNEENQMLIELVSNNDLDEVVFLLSARLSNQYYSERVNTLNSHQLKLEKVKSTWSWKLTKPIRMALKLVKSFTNRIEFIMLLFCYFLTKPYYSKKDIWLIGERSDQAEDNSYHFFKYCRTHQKQINIFYIIEKDCIQYKNVEKFGNIINHSSFKHKLFMLHATKFISAYHFLSFSYPKNGQSFQKKYQKYIQAKEVFLQHGVYIHDVSDWTFVEKNPYDLFITSSPFEKDYVVNELGYSEEVVQDIGLCRFDNLYNNQVKREILVMPTWRNYLRYQSPRQFVYSEYFRRYQDLLMDKRLIKILEENDLKLNFYIHSEMQKFIHLFKFENERIVIHTKQSSNVQQLLKSNSMLVTDYSSVSADMLYMNKPVLLYQFDPNEFHYNPSDYIRYSDMGTIVNNHEKLINLIEENVKNDFELSTAQLQKADLIYRKRDQENSKRTFEAIARLG